MPAVFDLNLFLYLVDAERLTVGNPYRKSQRKTRVRITGTRLLFLFVVVLSESELSIPCSLFNVQCSLMPRSPNTDAKKASAPCNPAGFYELLRPHQRCSGH
jgi:hypothetical protein